MRQDVLSPQARREVRRDTALRRARTCYGHLAGVAGVHLLEELLRLEWLEVTAADADAGRVGYAPTVAGAAGFGAAGGGGSGGARGQVDRVFLSGLDGAASAFGRGVGAGASCCAG